MTQPFRTRIGIIGGGQLGKMLVESALPWNVSFSILEASTDCPSYRYADKFIEGSLMDSAKIEQLAEYAEVLTYEIEHVNVTTLKKLEDQGKTVIPSSHILAIIQDKGKQKSFYKDQNLHTSHFVLTNADEVRNIDFRAFGGERVVVKSCTGGYDGKGVAILTKTDAAAGKAAEIFSGEVVVEEFIANAKELSVIVARNQKGQIVTYPVVEMVFDETINLVDYLFVPSAMSDTIQMEATELAKAAIEGLSGVGIFAVELFVDANDTCMINEIAPRPHNSGHQTIEANYTSQYEQLMRIMLGLPLGSTKLIMPAVMTNILGSSDVVGEYQLDGITELAETEGAFLHWYNKSQSKPGRKMGHFTVLDHDLNAAIEKSKHLKEKLKTTKA